MFLDTYLSTWFLDHLVRIHVDCAVRPNFPAYTLIRHSAILTLNMAVTTLMDENPQGSMATWAGNY